VRSAGRLGEGRDWTQQRTALRDALLRDLDLGGQPLASSGELRLLAWLSQRHLWWWWLLLPWWLVRIAWWFLFSGQRRAALASENRAIDLYRQVTGTDRKAARDQVVWRLEWHLAPLVDRPELPGLEPIDEPPGASRAELQVAMDALLDHVLAGRRTDDELLQTALALSTEHQDGMCDTYDRLVEQGITGRRAQSDAILAEVQAWRVRYRLAWRRWFDQQAEHGSATSPGQR
jgi:hypothetical protein